MPRTDDRTTYFKTMSEIRGVRQSVGQLSDMYFIPSQMLPSTFFIHLFGQNDNERKREKKRTLIAEREKHPHRKKTSFIAAKD